MSKVNCNFYVNCLKLQLLNLGFEKILITINIYTKANNISLNWKTQLKIFNFFSFISNKIFMSANKTSNMNIFTQLTQQN